LGFGFTFSDDEDDKGNQTLHEDHPVTRQTLEAEAKEAEFAR
jgi:hypothetical protein